MDGSTKTKPSLEIGKPSPLSGLLPRLLLASLAFGHLTEPIWLGLLSVALPDLAAAIANLFLLETFSPGVGTIEIWNNWSCGFENSLQRGKGRRISAGCHLLEEMGEERETLQTCWQGNISNLRGQMYAAVRGSSREFRA